MEWINDLRGKTVGLDTAPLIYFIEENPAYSDCPPFNPYKFFLLIHLNEYSAQVPLNTHSPGTKWIYSDFETTGHGGG